MKYLLMLLLLMSCSGTKSNFIKIQVLNCDDLDNKLKCEELHFIHIKKDDIMEFAGENPCLLGIYNETGLHSSFINETCDSFVERLNK